jgi:hypothetical protein
MLISTLYSKWPMRAVPDGMITFEVARELPRSLGETLLVYNSVRIDIHPGRPVYTAQGGR